MKPQDLTKLGIPKEAHTEAFELVRDLFADGGFTGEGVRAVLKAAAEKPETFAQLGTSSRTQHLVPTSPKSIALGRKLVELSSDEHIYRERQLHAPYRIWGDEAEIEKEATDQLRNATRLPNAVRGALMPDAHTGYGLPIGGVLAVRNAVIPYAVGVDIACRMRLTILDQPSSMLKQHEDKLIKAIERNTRFGAGAHYDKGYKRKHAVMDEDWDVSPVTKHEKQTAWAQLGTSGGGNHFVEFGVIEVTDEGLGIPTGNYFALMSHSGSRGTGHKVASYYSKLAMQKVKGLPQELKHLAWLSLDSEEGQEYMAAMNLMGRYAAANHELIHSNILRTLGAEELAAVENHHNFAWIEHHDGELVVVHRKGATPAHSGVLGVIPGSMGTSAFIVRGKGVPESLCSASHGAGRKMSRTKAKEKYTRKNMDAFLAERGVKLISAGIDECPMAYKDIHAVMAGQADLVEPIAEFKPKLVKMAPDKGKQR